MRRACISQGKVSFLLIIAGLCLAACSMAGSTPLPATSTPSVIPSLKPSPTLTVTLTPTSTPIPPTPTLPLPIPSPDNLLWNMYDERDKFKLACDRAWSLGGSISQPLPVQGYVEYVYSNTFTDEHYHDVQTSIAPYRAFTLGEVHALICVRVSRVQVDTYYAINPIPGGSNSAPAWQVNWKVRIISYPEGQLLAKKDFTGPNPPESISQNSLSAGVNYGQSPRKEFADWVYTLEVITPPPAQGEVAATFKTDYDVNYYSNFSNLSFSSDSRYLALGLSNDAKILLFSLEGLNIVHTISLADDDSGIDQLVFTSDSKNLVASTNHSLYQIDLDSGQVLESFRPSTGHLESTYTLDISLDGSTALLKDETSLIIWNTLDGTIRKLPLQSGPWMKLSPDGGMIAVMKDCYGQSDSWGHCSDQPLLVLDSVAGSIVQEIAMDFRWTPLFIPGTNRMVLCACTDYDNEHRCAERELIVWDAQTGEEIAHLKPRFEKK